MNICCNCERTFEDNYCGYCGQGKTHRISFKHVIHDFIHVFTHADKGIIQLIPKIITRPGHTAKTFIEGKRKIYNPFQFLVIIIGLNVLLLSSSDIFDKVVANALQSVKHLPPNIGAGLGKYFVFVQKYTTIISLATLPIYAFFTKLFFKSPRYNFGEHLTIQVFANAQIYSINIAILLFFIVFDLDASSTYYVICLMIACYWITYQQAFAYKWPSTMLKSFMSFLVSYLMQILFMIVFALIFVVFIVITH